MQKGVCTKVNWWQIKSKVKGNIYTTTEIYTKEDLKMAREAEQESTLLKKMVRPIQENMQKDRQRERENCC